MAVFDFALFRVLLVVTSTIFFEFLSNIFGIFKPKSVDLKNTLKWKNFSTSFLHSLLTGTGGIMCFIENPQLTDDMKHSSTQFSRALVCVSLGYFIYDAIRVLVHRKLSEDCGIFVHHIVVSLNFAIPAIIGEYTYVATVSLLGEVHSIFLHLRMLLKLTGVRKNTFTYRVNNILNFGTFIPFRTFPMIWIARWVYMNRHTADELYQFIVVVIGVVSVPLLNGGMLYRLIKADLMKPEKHLPKSE